MLEVRWLICLFLFLLCFISSSICSDTAYVKGVSSGDQHTIALSSDGLVFSWGRNDDGELGDGTTNERHSPVSVNMSGQDIIQVSAGNSHTMLLSNYGLIFGLGMNSHGELGNGANTGSPQPFPVSVNISDAGPNTIALSSDGSIFSWGNNDFGQLGDGTNISQVSPGPVNMSGVLSGQDIIQFLLDGSTHMQFQEMVSSFHGDTITTVNLVMEQPLKDCLQFQWS